MIGISVAATERQITSAATSPCGVRILTIIKLIPIFSAATAKSEAATITEVRVGRACSQFPTR